MLGKKLMVVGMVFLVIGIITMRYNEKISFCSDFVIGVIFGIAIGMLVLSIILSRKGM